MSGIEESLEALIASPVVVCIRHDDTDKARRDIQAVLAGGLRMIEVTLTTPGALELIAELADDDRAVAGAGTVLTPEQAQRVAEAGARFALSPVFEPGVVAMAQKLELLMAPGCSTPTEMHRAHRFGAQLIKVFPAGALGGADYIRAVRGPLPDIPILATNGVTLERLPRYFEAGVVAVGIGGASLFGADDAETTARSRAFVEAVAPYL